MKVLVTGGAGFIGSSLVERLVEEGHEVVVLDNEATGQRENVSDSARFIYGDVIHRSDLEKAFVAGPDAVLHMAGQVSLIRSFGDPVLDMRTNVEGTVNVLDMCLKFRVPRLLYASSMTVYGNNATNPISETAFCCPSSYYGITKYAAERYVHATSERRDLNFDFQVTSFRMFNVYGPQQALDNPYQGVLGIFLGNLLRSEAITIFGDGEQTRDFIYITDVVDAWIWALDNSRTYGQVINLGSGVRLSINHLADQILAAFGRTRADTEIVYSPARSGEQRHVAADVSRARKLLRWKHQISLENGLRKNVHWARVNFFSRDSNCDPAPLDQGEVFSNS